MAKEFNKDVEEVKRWPIRKFMKYAIALSKWYEMQSGQFERASGSQHTHLNRFHFMEMD